MVELLSIPFKRTLTLDLVASLSKVINASSYQSASFFKDDLLKINTTRESIINPDISENSLQLLKEYYIYLKQLTQKFPDDQIEFSWFQTISQKSWKCSQYSFRFEQLNILYSIGAMFNLLAFKYNDGTKEGLKKSCIYLQYSAGYFKFVREHLSDTKEPVVNMSTIECLIKISLASAQEVFWFRAMQDINNNGLLSKLTKQISNYYSEALLFAQKSELIRQDWINYLNDKAMYFNSVAYYRNALQLGERKKHGAMIRSLEIALESLQSCKLELSSQLKDSIEMELKDVQRDNDFIYLEEVPSNIPEIVGTPTVKPFDSVEDELNRIEVPKLFKDLLPIQVLDASSAYNERQQEYVTSDFINPILALNKILKEHIPTEQIPSDMEMVSREDIAICEKSFKEFQQHNRYISKETEKIRSSLERECQVDKECRLKYGTLSWTLTGSKELNQGYYDRLEKLGDYLNQGAAINEVTVSTFRLIDQDLLVSPISIPQSTDPLMERIALVFQEREQVITRIENKSLETKILPKIISAYKATGQKTFESEFKEHLQEFEPFKQAIVKIKQSNAELIHELDRSSAENNDSEVLRRLTPKDIYIADWKQSVQLLQNVQENIKDGYIFYKDLVGNVELLSNDVDKYVNSRRDAVEALASQLARKENARFELR